MRQRHSGRDGPEVPAVNAHDCCPLGSVQATLKAVKDGPDNEERREVLDTRTDHAAQKRWYGDFRPAEYPADRCQQQEGQGYGPPASHDGEVELHVVPPTQWVWSWAALLNHWACCSAGS
ncbi:hypothetical protein GCM10010342_71200 [Streptomyces anulatus]|nr:hypothetical protein GCM10010342_71200 [Streptomyces anulatus]